MIILLSPAKSLNFDPRAYLLEPTQAKFRGQSKVLVEHMQSLKAQELKELMHISDALAELNYSRYQFFKKVHKTPTSKPSIYAFVGDVYRGLQAETFDKADLRFAQDHMRILSGLYGILRPMDLIQQYRLEMGTKLKTEDFKSLYDFWDMSVTKVINKDLKHTDSSAILNLASNEYFKVVKKDALKKPVVNIHFRENKGGELKFVSFTAKVARGMMSHFVIKNKIKDVDALKAFDYDNYLFEESMSSENELYFVR